MAGEGYSWRHDPSVPAFPDDRPLIVFDGLCVLCSANARFLLRQDKGRRFSLTTAQGPLGQALYRHFGLSTADYQTMLVVEAGRLFTQSDAALRIAAGLGWPWRAAVAARLIPRRARDAGYRLIARNRFRLFGRRAECWLPSAEERGRVL